MSQTILYSLNLADNEQSGTLLGCFRFDEIPGKSSTAPLDGSTTPRAAYRQR